MTTHSTDLRLLRLERRVNRIERQLNLPDEIDLPQPPAATEMAFADRVVLETKIAPTPPAEMPVASSVESEPIPLSSLVKETDPYQAAMSEVNATPAPSAVQPAAPKQIAPPPLPYATKLPRPPKAQPRQLEQTIGLKWAGWIGAIVLVIGAVLGVKFAYENHWFGGIPPTVWLALIMSAGLALIAGGEVVLRRVHAIPAASLFGAGVATLFVGAYVGHAYYDLYSRSTAMTLMAVSTLIGAAVAMRGNLVSIAVLSLIGANVAPMLVAAPDAPVVPFLFYLLMMQTVALVLAAWGRGGKWWTLRGLSLAATALWLSGVLFSTHGYDWVVLWFALTYAALYHAELILSTLRATHRSQPAEQITATQLKVVRAAPGIAFSLFVTAAQSVWLLAYFADSIAQTRAMWMIGLSAVVATLGIALPFVHASLRPLAMTHRIAAAALLVLAVPVATDGASVEIGWAALAVVFAAAWALTGSIVSRHAAPITWMLCVGRLVGGSVDELGEPAAFEVWFTLLNTHIVSTLVLAWVFAIAGHVAGRLMIVERDPQVNETSRNTWLFVARVLSILASVLGIAASIAYLPPLGATACIIVYAWLLIGGDVLVPQLALAVQAFGALLIATVKWAVIDTISARLATEEWTRTLPVLNPLMGIGALLAGSLVGLYWLRRRALWRALRPDGESDVIFRANWALALIALVTVLMSLGLSFEIDRIIERAAAAGKEMVWPIWQAKQFAWTMLWSLSAAVLLVAMARLFAADSRARWLGRLWIVPAILGVKYFFVDTLLYRFWSTTNTVPIANLQVLTGVCVIGLLALTRLLMPSDPVHGTLRRMRSQVGMLALFVVAWMGTLEIDRAAERMYGSAALFGFAGHVKQLGWTIWWSAVVCGAFAVWRRFDRTAPANEPWVRLLPLSLSVIALKYLSIDTIAWRVMHDPIGWTLLANLEALAAAAVIGGLFLLCVLGLPESAKHREPSLRKRCGAFIVLALLWAGTLEVDRAFWLPSIRAGLTDARLAEQVALSIFWSAFAVAALIFGFRLRIAGLRYFGLTLLALALLKVVVIDLQQVAYGYRVLSFLGLGGLLLGTSVLYGKVSPKLLREE